MGWTKVQLDAMNDMIVARERLAYAKGWVNALSMALDAVTQEEIRKWREDWQKVVEVLTKDLEFIAKCSGLKAVDTRGQPVLPVWTETKTKCEEVAVTITPWQVHFPDGTTRPFLTEDYSNRQLRRYLKRFKKIAKDPKLTHKERMAWQNFSAYVEEELMWREMRL